MTAISQKREAYENEGGFFIVRTDIAVKENGVLLPVL
jgi:hypothetical protein